MPDTIKDVKPGSSAGDVNVDSSSTDDLVKIKADNKRLEGALSSLQKERDEIRGEVEELREIKQKYGELSARQQTRMNELRREGADVEAQLSQWRRELLQKNPDAENWFTDVELKLAKATKTASDLGANQASLERAADLLDELAEELSESDEFKDMTDEKLLKVLKPYMGQFETKSPYLKTKKAFKAWKSDQAYRKEKSESDKKKAEDGLSQENGTRQARESSVGDLMQKKGSLDTSDKALLREKLGIVQRSR